MNTLRQKYPSERQDKFVLRMPDGVRDELKEAAAENGRSMNAEIIARLGSPRNNLRDQFAMAALVSMGTWPQRDENGNYPEDIPQLHARWAYQIADAMLKAREDNQ